MLKENGSPFSFLAFIEKYAFRSLKINMRETFFTFLRKTLAKGKEAWYYRRAVPRGTQPNTDN